MDENKSAGLRLLSQELNGNPYRRLNFAFILISIIPILAFSYLLIDRVLSGGNLLAGMGAIIFFTCAILILGYIVAYNVIKNIINTALIYAQKAKRADELKSTFAISLAHDLKTPIMTMKANISNLKSNLHGELNSGQAGAIDVCREVTDRMNSIIMELMEIYMIEAQIIKLKRTKFDLRELVEGQKREIEPIGGARWITVDLSLPAEPLLIEGDREKITRVINNLLGNAIKYSPEGGTITVKAYDAEGFARLEIISNGPAIPDDSLERIFDKFERLDNHAEGHGLGLAIAKDIVELHRGRIWATSGPDNKNCFTVVMALADPKEIS